MVTIQPDSPARTLSCAIAKFVALAIVLPLAPVFLLNLPLPATLALMSSTFLIEYGAAPVGIALGLPPAFVLWVLAWIAAGVTILLFDIFGVIGEQSARVSAFLAKAGERAKKSKILARYGIYALAPLVWTLGFYVCPPVSWVQGLDRTRSFMIIMTGYLAASIVTILGSLGVLQLISL
jgi:hypothetical protein